MILIKQKFLFKPLLVCSKAFCAAAHQQPLLFVGFATQNSCA